MLAGLDPHSSYMDSKSFRDMQVQTRGEFGGLGIEVTMEDGLIKVVAPLAHQLLPTSLPHVSETTAFGRFFAGAGFPKSVFLRLMGVGLIS